ncbi:unnamed protein product, partial [Iphiclides podalirius]
MIRSRSTPFRVSIKGQSGHPSGSRCGRIEISANNTTHDIGICVVLKARVLAERGGGLRLSNNNANNNAHTKSGLPSSPELR